MAHDYSSEIKKKTKNLLELQKTEQKNFTAQANKQKNPSKNDKILARKENVELFTSAW